MALEDFSGWFGMFFGVGWGWLFDLGMVLGNVSSIRGCLFGPDNPPTNPFRDRLVVVLGAGCFGDSFLVC